MSSLACKGVRKLTCGYGPKWLTPHQLHDEKKKTKSVIPSAPKIFGASYKFCSTIHGDQVIFKRPFFVSVSPTAF